MECPMAPKATTPLRNGNADGSADGTTFAECPMECPRDREKRMILNALCDVWPQDLVDLISLDMVSRDVG